MLVIFPAAMLGKCVGMHLEQPFHILKVVLMIPAHSVRMFATVSCSAISKGNGEH